jgi:hypothetical protein
MSSSNIQFYYLLSLNEKNSDCLFSEHFKLATFRFSLSTPNKTAKNSN